MSEAKTPGSGLSFQADQPDLEVQLIQLQKTLSWIQDHGNKEDCAQAIESIEGVISSLNCSQAGLAHQLEKDVLRENEERGTNLDDQVRGAASRVAIARKRSQHGSRNYMTNCRILFEDTPNILAAYSRGEFTEAQIQAMLTPLQDVPPLRRAEFDSVYGQHPDMFESMGPKRIKETVANYTVKYASDREDKKLKEANEHRYVRFRTDREAGCVFVQARLPIVGGLGLQMSLRQQSYKIKSKGDPRNRTQIQADLLSRCMFIDENGEETINVQLGLIMTDKALFMGDREPAYLEGYGYIPAQTARELISGQSIPNEMTFEEMDANLTPENIERIEVVTEIMRLYTAPGDQELIAMDSKARFFPPKLKKFIRIRDRHCRTPFCDGLVEETDHVTQFARGGKTNASNSLGRCEICNKAKQATGWYEYSAFNDRHSILICPGSSMSYRSTAPPATGYLHESFPQLMCESQWFNYFKERLHRPVELRLVEA
ncbi:HNH endonuclease [Glutamicibacter sp. JC586]|uniref:HNH endonuclease n=1 Tax=Glutamicibacter sp. JC586 TaxID=2590552 RepID=UPI0013592198|nr:HNH endonuclease [Glutamicibacter sp. JC586]